MKHIKYLLMTGWALMILSCSPDDDPTLGELMNPSELKYTITQDPSYDNKVVLRSLTPGVIPYWDYEIGTSAKAVDTIIIPFRGDFWVKYRAFGQGGSASDSTMITISELDPNYFADDAWEKLTNGEFGKTWKLVAVKAGDVKSTTYSDWGDASWTFSNVSFDDSVHFNLDKSFNFIRYTDGVPKKSAFGIITNEKANLAGTAIENGITPEGGSVRALTILGGNNMPSSDASREMAPQNKNRYIIYKIEEDLLILGQGAYYTENDKGGGWTYWHWYKPTH